MRFISLFLFILQLTICFSQTKIIEHRKLPIQPQDLNDTWTSPKWIDISNNGKFISYTIQKLPLHPQTLIIENLQSKQQFEYTCIGRSWFTSDSHKIIWINASHILCILSLNNMNISYINNVQSFSIFGKYLYYLSSLPTSEFVIIELTTGIQKSYTSVSQFQVCKDEKHVVILKEQTERRSNILVLVSLANKKETIIWEGKGLRSLVIDSIASQLAFLGEENTIWYYKKKEGLSTMRIGNLPTGLYISWINNFNTEGNCLFVELGKEKNQPPFVNSVHLKIWNYENNRLSSEESGEVQGRNKTAIIRLFDQRIVSILKEDELAYFPGQNKITDTICVVSSAVEKIENVSNKGILSTRCWYLLHTQSGNKIPLNFINNAVHVSISPGGKYIIYLDRLSNNFFSYEIISGKVKNITSKIKDDWIKNFDTGFYGYTYICGWIKDDKALLVYSQHDIWQIDPTAVIHPINLTNGYGRNRNLKFFLALEEYKYRFLNNNERIILTAFNSITKENGFYSIETNVSKDPDSLTMGPFLYCITDNPWIPSQANFPPLKAKYSNKYIVRQMSSRKAPNLFYTSDFKEFNQLTYFQPEKNYNWYSSELHTWKSPDGIDLQGILYKPDDFDIAKKYPVIFYFYEKMSDRLNIYIKAENLTGGSALNIPYYVSNGYLVFCPDIYYKLGDPMQGTYNAIVSAAYYISSLSFVNQKKIGLQGSSWGAIQINYLITHTNIFSAACSSSGLSDWISGYGSLMSDGTSQQEMYESGQLRVGATLWEKPEIYIKNSAVLNADKVTTPLLMMHTTDDEICPFPNILEFFSALRRLGKHSWLLEYKGNHTLTGKDTEDFSIRMKQFFDHYLMDKPAPKWMTQGISAKMQRLDSGLGLDN